MNDLRNALVAALNPDIAVRQKSETILKAAQKQPEVIRQLPAFFGDSDPVVRKLSSVFYKNSIIEEWPLGTYDLHKKFIIDNLLFVVMQCDCNLVTEVEKVIECILQSEGLNELNTVISHAQSLLNSANEREYAASLVFYKTLCSVSKYLHNSDSFEKVMRPCLPVMIPVLKSLVSSGSFVYAKWVVKILSAVIEARCSFFDENMGAFELIFQTIIEIMNLRIKNDNNTNDTDFRPHNMHQNVGANQSNSTFSDSYANVSAYCDDSHPNSYLYLKDFQNIIPDLNLADPFGLAAGNSTVSLIDPNAIVGKYAYAKTGTRTSSDHLHSLQSACSDLLTEIYTRAGKKRPVGRVSQSCASPSVLSCSFKSVRALLGWHVPLLASDSNPSAGARLRDRLVRACIAFFACLVESKSLRPCVLGDASFVALGITVPLLRFSPVDCALFFTNEQKFLRDRYSLYAADARSHASLLISDVLRRLRREQQSSFVKTLTGLLLMKNPQISDMKDPQTPYAPGQIPNSPSHHKQKQDLNHARTVYAVMHCLTASIQPSNSLVQQLLHYLTSDVPFLRAQACYCLQYCDSDTMPINEMAIGFERVLSETNSPLLVLRVDALVATSFFFPIDALRVRFEGAAPALIRQLLDAQANCEVEALGSTLEGLIAHFPAAVASSAPILVSQLCSLMRSSIGNGDEDLVHTHQAYLRTIQGLVFAFQPRCHKKEAKNRTNSNTEHSHDDNENIHCLTESLHGDDNNNASATALPQHIHLSFDKNDQSHKMSKFAHNTIIRSQISFSVDLRSPFRVNSAEMATSHALVQAVIPFYEPILNQIFSRRLADFYDEALQLLGETTFCLRSSNQTIWHLTKLALSIPDEDRALVANDLAFALDNVLSFSTVNDSRNYIADIVKFYQQMTALEDGLADGDDDHSIGTLGMTTVLIHFGEESLSLIPNFLASATAYQNVIDPFGAAHVHLSNLITLSILLNFETTMDYLVKNNMLAKYFEDLATNIKNFARVFDMAVLLLLALFIMSNDLKNIHCVDVISEQEKHFEWTYNQIMNQSHLKNIHKYEIFGDENFKKQIASILAHAIENLPEAIAYRKKIIEEDENDEDYFEAIVDEEPLEETLIDYFHVNNTLKYAFHNLNQFGQSVVSILTPETIQMIRNYLH